MINIEADDIAGAAAHQQRIERIHSMIREQYEQARLDFRQPRLSVRLHLPSDSSSDFEE